MILKFYKTDEIRSQIIENMVQLVTENIKKCLISCSITYDSLKNIYWVNINTTGGISSAPRFIRLGKYKVVNIVKKIFTGGTGARIIMRYNNYANCIFTDSPK